MSKSLLDNLLLKSDSSDKKATTTTTTTTVKKSKKLGPVGMLASLQESMVDSLQESATYGTVNAVRSDEMSRSEKSAGSGRSPSYTGYSE